MSDKERERAAVEVHAIENGETVGIYVSDIRRAVSWARRANPNAAFRVIRARSALNPSPEGSGNAA